MRCESGLVAANDSGARPERCGACAVRDSALCSSFANAELSGLSSIGRRRIIPAGQVLIWAGDPITICANLVSGVLKVVRKGVDGREQIVGLLFPGDFVGDLFDDQSAETVVALADADLCVYPRRALDEVLDQHPIAKRLLLRRALATLTDTRKWMLMLGRRQASERVAAFLLDIGRRLGEGANSSSFDLPMTRAAIGDALGLTIETVSRQMTLLKAAGLIALPGGRRLTLLDRAGLQRLAG